MSKEIKNRTFIIAEAGVNHNGDLKIAKRMVDAAKKSGVDAIKFQTFRAEDEVCKDAPTAAYQVNSNSPNESQFEMIKKLELNNVEHKLLWDYCINKGILFLSSPFDLGSIDLLNNLGLKIFKIPSGEITNLPFLRKIGKLKKKIILSSGISTLSEIQAALNILIISGTKRTNITILQCTSAYPCPYKDANLLAIKSMRDHFKMRVGFSDHTLGIEAALAAVALGATLVEKHFTLDRNMSGPDHKASLEPRELTHLVKCIRKVELCLGDGVKVIRPSEAKNRNIVRKSIVASVRIKKGEIFSKLNLTTKRPGIGISPMNWDRIIGKTSKKDFAPDDFIQV